MDSCCLKNERNLNIIGAKIIFAHNSKRNSLEIIPYTLSESLGNTREIKNINSFLERVPIPTEKTGIIIPEMIIVSENNPNR